MRNSRERGDVRKFRAYGMLVALRADAGTTIATGVSGWAGQHGTSVSPAQAVGAAQPAFSATGTPNGKACINFDGADDILNAAYAQTQPMHVFLVGKWGGAGTGTIVCGGGNNLRFWRVSSSSANWQGNSATPAAIASITPDAWHVHDLLFDGAGSSYFEDGVSKSTANIGVADAAGIGIGGLTGFGGQFAVCSVAEVYKFTAAMPSSVRSRIRRALGARNGVAI